MCAKFILFVILFCLFSCTNNNTDIKLKNNEISIAGYINNEPVPLSDIDKTIKQELYDELYRIYIIRKTALNEYFKEYMLQTEAKNNNISKEQYLNNYVQKYLTDKNLAEFINKNKINIIPELKRTLNYYDVNSIKGKAIIAKSYKQHLINKLIDSLKTIYKPTINIQPPIPPKVSLENIYIHYRGNLNSSVTLIEVSDIECSKCREYFPVYENIYQKYKNKVKFGFAHFSSYFTLSALATECSAKQGKFWEMQENIFKCKQLPDTNEVFLIAKKLNLNMDLFTNDFYNPEISQKIEYNFKLIKYMGIYATPTILINGKPVFDSSSQKEIENVVEQTLN